MIRIKDTKAILIQPMYDGLELFVGAVAEGNFGHQVMAGLGGVFIEVLEDVQSGWAPLSEYETEWMLKKLTGYKLLEGGRGRDAVDIEKYINVIRRVSTLVTIAPEIVELDLNPLLATSSKVIAVDARMRIEHI